MNAFEWLVGAASVFVLGLASIGVALFVRSLIELYEETHRRRKKNQPRR